jgi:hypothetical protein
MTPMKATFNPRVEQLEPEVRSNCRYRLARLLLLEQFDQALQEAEIAHDRHNIVSEDLRFVRDIIEDARGQSPSSSSPATWHDSLPKSNRHDHSR